MFDFVEGELVSKSPTQIVVASGGVGYRFTVPLSTFDAFSGESRAKVLAYLHVREDELRLYGFATEGERRLFVRLIGLSGIGPGTAIALLSGMSVDEFRSAVGNQDLTGICRVKGIGRKTAERIVVELKDEMARELLESPVAGVAASPLTSDAVAAMLALGYRRSDSEKAIARAFEKLGRDTPIEEIVRKALQLV